MHEYRSGPAEPIPGGTRRDIDPRLTVEALAVTLKVSKNFIRRDIRSRKLVALVNVNGTYLLTYPDVITWLEHRRTRLGLYSDVETVDRLRRTYARIIAGQSAA